MNIYHNKLKKKISKAIRMKDVLVKLYKFPAALFLFSLFSIILIIRDKVFRLPLEPYAEYSRAILNNNVPVVAGMFWFFIGVRLMFKFLFPLLHQ